MRRLLPLAMLLVGVPLAVSAPVPKPPSQQEQVRKLLGEVTLPEKGCEFRIDGNTVKAKLPKEPVAHPEVWARAMRSEREVIGNFELTARLRTTAAMKPLYEPEKGARSIGGGLVAFDPDAKEPKGRAVSLSRWFLWVPARQNGVGAWGWGGVPNGRSNWVERREAVFPRHSRLYADGGADPSSGLYLRLARRGSEIETAISTDGKDWHTWAVREVEFGRSAAVGVWASNLTGEPADVIFEDFKVTPLK